MTHTRPPGSAPADGLACAWGTLAALAAPAAAFAILASVPGAASAQVVHGTIRTQEKELFVAGAKVTVVDSLGAPLGETLSDARGRFTLVLKATAPFQLSIYKLGWTPSSTDWIRAARTDTLEYDLLVPAEPIGLSLVNVSGEKSFNTRAFEDAKRLGWKVYGPDLVEQHRNTSSTFLQLLRQIGATGVIIDDHPEIGAVRGRGNGPGGACVRSMRTNRCLVVVLDGVLAGYTPPVETRDIYFLAVLTASESTARWGADAPWGAIVIYTRQNGDKKNP
jgi:hypothetical protein